MESSRLTGVYLGVAVTGATHVSTTVTRAATNATMTNMYGAGLSGVGMVQAKGEIAVVVSDVEGALEAMATSTH